MIRSSNPKCRIQDINNYDEFYGAPGAIRTPDLLNRNQMLYPAELRVPEGEEHYDACNPLKGQ